VATAEASIINETVQWMKDVGLNTEFLKENTKSEVTRSDKVIIVKNLAYVIT